jgi:hypothetical protein
MSNGATGGSAYDQRLCSEQKGTSDVRYGRHHFTHVYCGTYLAASVFFTTSVVDAFCVQAWFSMLSRRFPRLQTLSADKISRIVNAGSKQKAHVYTHAYTHSVKTWPKSRQVRRNELVFLNGSEPIGGLEATQLYRSTKAIKSVLLDTDTQSQTPKCHGDVARTMKGPCAARDNQAWLWAAEAWPGQVHWKPSGKFVAREDAARGRLEVRLHRRQSRYLRRELLQSAVGKIRKEPRGPGTTRVSHKY